MSENIVKITITPNREKKDFEVETYHADGSSDTTYMPTIETVFLSIYAQYMDRSDSWCRLHKKDLRVFSPLFFFFYSQVLEVTNHLRENFYTPKIK